MMRQEMRVEESAGSYTPPTHHPCSFKGLLPAEMLTD